MSEPYSTARALSESFSLWAKRSALPLPATPEEPFGESAQAVLDRLLEGKRFVFLGEPDHFIVEKYPFRLTLTRFLFARGWRHASMETGRSVGWRVDRYLETGDASCLSTEGAESPGLTALAIHGKTLGFIDAHENTFHERLRQISEARAPGTFWGLRSWLRALGYQAFFKVTRSPMNMGSSVGGHLYRRFPGQVLSIWMLCGQGTLMMPAGPRTVRLHGDTIESLLSEVGDRFLLPLDEVDPPVRAILSQANFRSASGEYASADLTAQADAIYFVREVNAE